MATKGENMKKYLPILKEMPLFKHLDEEGILFIINYLDGYEKTYEKHEIIYNFLDRIEYAGIVLQGQIDMIMLNFVGNEYGSRRFIKGNLFGVAYSCIPSEESVVQVVSQEKSKVLFLKLSNLFLPKSIHCTYTAQMTTNFLIETAKNNIFQNAKIQILIQRHIRDKLIIYLCSISPYNNSITIPFNRQELANYLGVDRSALSRELSNMKKEGLIDFHKNKIYILKKALLYEGQTNML